VDACQTIRNCPWRPRSDADVRDVTHHEGHLDHSLQTKCFQAHVNTNCLYSSFNRVSF
jgi:hypothetical protein